MKVAFYITSSKRSPVEEFIQSLPKQDQARFADVIVSLQGAGFSCPRIKFRQLRGKLWEIKFSTASGGYRIAYVIAQESVMIWLHVFKKKTQKTPVKDIELAEKRMKEVLGL